MPTIQVEINNVNGQHVPTITSLQVAEVFGKNHKEVLRDIQNILSQVSEIFNKRNFTLNEVEVKVGFGTRRDPAYQAE